MPGLWYIETQLKHTMKFQQLSLSNYICRRALEKTEGWVDFNETLTDEDIEQIVGVLGGHLKTRDSIRRTLKNVSQIKDCGIYKRMIKEENGWQYCAGQDYPGELAFLRKLLK